MRAFREINNCVLEGVKKKKATLLADAINKVPGYNILEIRFPIKEDAYLILYTEHTTGELEELAIKLENEIFIKKKKPNLTIKF